MFPLLLLLLVFLASALLVAGANYLALDGWRRTSGVHWAERARILYPARVGANWNVTLVMLAVVIFRREHLPDWGKVDVLWELVASGLGAVAGTWFFVRTITPTVTWRVWVQETTTQVVLTALRIGFFMGIAFSMPKEWDDTATIKVAAFIVFDLWLAFAGPLRVFRALGWVPDAPERVRRLAAEVAAQTGQSLPPLWVVASTHCNAHAVPWPRSLVFTRPLLDLLDDAQLTCIIRHEMAHLSEGKLVPLARMSALLGFWPFLATRPLVAAFGAFAFVLLLGWRMVVHSFIRKIAHRMELRADRHSIGHAPEDAALYAQTLARIYEANAMPAVTASPTHPSLYDRMFTAGITPDFPRPAQPSNLSGITLALLIILGALLAPLITEFLHRLRR